MLNNGGGGSGVATGLGGAAATGLLGTTSRGAGVRFAASTGVVVLAAVPTTGTTTASSLSVPPAAPALGDAAGSVW